MGKGGRGRGMEEEGEGRGGRRVIRAKTVPQCPKTWRQPNQVSPAPTQRPQQHPSRFHPTYSIANSRTASIQPPILHKFPHPISRPPCLPPSLFWSCSTSYWFIKLTVSISTIDPPPAPETFSLISSLTASPRKCRQINLLKTTNLQIWCVRKVKVKTPSKHASTSVIQSITQPLSTLNPTQFNLPNRSCRHWMIATLQITPASTC